MSVSTTSSARWSRLLFSVTLLLSTHFSVAAKPDDPGKQNPKGVQFYDGTWQEVLAEAKRQNKPIFLDLYASWCRPCKQLAQQAFPDRSVGKVFNSNFISYQLNGEKGEGLRLGRKFMVTYYPTQLYLSPDGDLLHRATGYTGIKTLLSDAEKALEAAQDPRPLSAWEAEYNRGNRNPIFLKAYLTKRTTLGLPNERVLLVHLATIPQAYWTADTTLALISGNLTNTTSKPYTVLLREARKLQATPRSPLFRKLIDAAGVVSLRDEQQAKTESDLQRVITNRLALLTLSEGKPLSATRKTDISNGIKLSFYRLTQNRERYRAVATRMANELMALSEDTLKARDMATYQRFLDMTKNASDSLKKTVAFAKREKQMRQSETQFVANRLAALAANHLDLMTVPTDLKQALTWSTRAITLQAQPTYLDTHARLLDKLGRTKEAIDAEKQAITLAKTTGDAPDEYEETLARLKE